MKKHLKIGFIPSSWESWDGNASTGRLAEKMRDRCLAAMCVDGVADIIVPGKELTEGGLVGSIEDGKKAADLFLAENIDALVVGNMNFGMEVAVGETLSYMRHDLPILHFCTRSGPITGEGNRSTDNWCGQFMTLSSIKRRGFTYTHILTSNPEEERFKTGFANFVKAIYTLKCFKNAKIGQLGVRPTLFESQYFSEENFQRKFGQMLRTMDLATVFDRMDRITDDELEIAEALASMTAESECLLNKKKLPAIAKYEVALKRIYRELGADCMAVCCWEMLQTRYGIAGCSTFARLNDQGYITACEVDVLGAVSMLAAYAAGLERTPPIFIDWTDLHPDEQNCWLAWHCGNAAPSQCAAVCRRKLMQNERLAVWSDNCDGSIEFNIAPGPVTCLRLVEYEGEYTMFIGTGEIVDIPPFIRGTYAWVKVKDIDDWERKMVEAGVIHHGVLLRDPSAADALELFCKYAGIHVVRAE
jgi:L-fucose isomerase and related proteins